MTDPPWPAPPDIPVIVMASCEVEHGGVAEGKAVVEAVAPDEAVVAGELAVVPFPPQALSTSAPKIATIGHRGRVVITSPYPGPLEKRPGAADHPRADIRSAE